MEKIVGKVFRDTTVNLDFSEYEKCTFSGCRIHTDFGIFKAVNCDFGGCKLSLGIAASNVAKLIRIFYPDMPFWVEGEETKRDVLLRMKERLRKEGML